MADQQTTLTMLTSRFAEFILAAGNLITVNCLVKRPNRNFRDLNQIVQTTFHCLHQPRELLHCQLPPDPHDAINCFERSTLLSYPCRSAGFDRRQGVRGGLPPYELAARRNTNG